MIGDHAVNESEINPPVTESNFKAKKGSVLSSIAVRSLKELQNETRAIELDFFERVYELETKFQKLHESVYQKRFEIVKGEYIPTEADGSQSADENSLEQKKLPGKGVPHFWLNVLTSTFTDVHEKDRPILEHLTDVRSKNKPLSDLGFILEFHFSPNDYFENAVLTKEYFYTSTDNKMIHEIPLIRKCVGCEIKWKDKKAPTHLSWFDFLASSKIISNSEDEFMSYITGIQKDFEMGYFIKEHVIPKAVSYFTGEETNLFNICNYTTGTFWSSLSSISAESSTEASVSLDVESDSGSETKTETGAQEQRKISDEF